MDATVADLVRARLSGLGYEPSDTDTPGIEMAVLRGECRLKALTNLAEVPAGLLYVWVDMAAGEFLSEKRATGGLPEHEFTPGVKSVSEGDTSVTYTTQDTQATDARFDALLERLMNPSESLIAAYRRVKW